MADQFEFSKLIQTIKHISLDSTAPTWENVISGQVNMRDAVRETIDFTNPNGKKYALRKDGQLATLLVR